MKMLNIKCELIGIMSYFQSWTCTDYSKTKIPLTSKDRTEINIGLFSKVLNSYLLKIIFGIYING